MSGYSLNIDEPQQDKTAYTTWVGRNSSRVFNEDLVQILNLRPIWQASDWLSPRARESARRAFLKFAPEPWRHGPLMEGFCPGGVA